MTDLNQHKWAFLRYCKDFANLLFSVLWVWLAMTTKFGKIKLQESLKFICKQLLPSLPSCKDIAKLSFWVLWICLAMVIKNNSISLYKTLMFMLIPKNKFNPHLFFETLLRYYKVVILSTLGTRSHATKSNSITLQEIWCLFTCKKST